MSFTYSQKNERSIIEENKDGKRRRKSQGDMMGTLGVGENIVCTTCKYRIGKPPYADSPLKGNCQAYTYENGNSKPDSVYFDGEDCEYYEQWNYRSIQKTIALIIL